MFVIWLNNEEDHLLCPNVDSFVHERGTTAWESWANRGSLLGQNTLVLNYVCLTEKGTGCFPKCPRQRVTCSPAPPTCSSESHPCPFEPIVPYTCKQHGFVPGLEHQRAAHSRLKVNAKSRDFALPMCPHLLPCSQQSCLPVPLTSLFTRSKHSDPRGLATVKATCPSAPTPKPNQVSP